MDDNRRIDEAKTKRKALGVIAFDQRLTRRRIISHGYPFHVEIARVRIQFRPVRSPVLSARQLDGVRVCLVC